LQCCLRCLCVAGLRWSCSVAFVVCVLQVSGGVAVLPSLPQEDTGSEGSVSVAQCVQNVSNVRVDKKVGPAVTAKPKKTSRLSDPGEYSLMDFA